MPKTKEQKQTSVEAYKQKIQGSKALLFLRPSGITVGETVDLKKQLYAKASDYNVVKNTLFKIALRDLGMPEVADLDNGANAVVFCNDDIAGVAKLVKEYTKKMEARLESGYGILEGSLLSKSQVTELADMPPKEVIIAQILGILESPIAGVANVLQDSVRSIAYVLDQAFKA